VAQRVSTTLSLLSFSDKVCQPRARGHAASRRRRDTGRLCECMCWRGSAGNSGVSLGFIWGDSALATVLAQTLREVLSTQDAHHNTENEWCVLVSYDCCVYWADFLSYSVKSHFGAERVKFPCCYWQSSSVRFQSLKGQGY
jgi:hypothetical protein